jgi:transaldolase
MDVAKIPMDKENFERMHAADKMATDKLKEGIEGFTKSLVSLEDLLKKRLARAEAEKMAVR